MSRAVEALHPAVAGLCRKFISACKERGIRVVVTSTLRTEAEQLALFSQGRTALKVVNTLRKKAGMPAITEAQNKRTVTNSLTSAHQFGCAFDVCIVREGKNPVWDIKADINANSIPDYEEIGRLGEAIGLAWGGRFRFRDMCHFEYAGGIAGFKKGLRPKVPVQAEAKEAVNV